jgi:DNA repair exonuclease SbcCD ATPase subunit
MSITPTPFSRSEGPPSGEAFTPPPTEGNVKSHIPVIILAIVVVIGLGGLFLYTKGVSDRLVQVKSTLDNTLATQAQNLEKLGRRQEQADTRTNELQGTVSVTQNRLGMTQSELQKAHQIAADLAKQQQASQESAAQLASQVGQLQQEQVSTKGAVGSLSTDVTGVKSEVKSTKEDLAATKSQLQSVMGDLGVQSGLIAHTKSDLDELRARGERDYIEFDLRKSNKPKKVGAIQLELKKTDPKKLRYTLDLTVDDKNIEKKDKTVFEPVQFYQQGNRMPSEIVVNQVYKDRIVGYISMPKMKEQRVPMKTPS